MSVYLLRHGETEWNHKGKLQGLIDTKLNENGINQAKNVAEYFLDKQIDIIYTSPLKRAYDTACIIAKEIDSQVIKIDCLKEMPLVNCQTMEKKYWFEHRKEFYHFEKLVTSCFNRIIRDKRNILIVGHGTWIKIILCKINNELFFNNTSFEVDNCEVVEIELNTLSGGVYEENCNRCEDK